VKAKKNRQAQKQNENVSTLLHPASAFVNDITFNLQRIQAVRQMTD